MRSKLLILFAAILLGVAAAFAGAVYVGGARQTAEGQAEPVEVLVAKQDIARGTQVQDLLTGQLIERRMVPRQYVAAGAISATRTLDGKVLAAAITKGEQLTQGRFQFPSSAGLSYTIPKDYLALSIPYTEVRGIGGLLKPGDSVAVLATLPDKSGQLATRILLPKAKVLAMGQSVGVESSAPSQSNGIVSATTVREPSQQQTKVSSVTLALSPQDVEKLVYAQENAKVWLALLPAEQAQAPETPGRTQLTLYDK